MKAEFFYSKGAYGVPPAICLTLLHRLHHDDMLHWVEPLAIRDHRDLL